MSKESEDSAWFPFGLLMLTSRKLDDWIFLVGYWIFDSPVTPPHHPSALEAETNQMPSPWLVKTVMWNIFERSLHNALYMN